MCCSSLVSENGQTKAVIGKTAAIQPDGAAIGNNYYRSEGQNVGNFLTDRPSSRVLAPPGGGSQISFGGEGPQSPNRKVRAPVNVFAFHIICLTIPACRIKVVHKCRGSHSRGVTTQACSWDRKAAQMVATTTLGPLVRMLATSLQTGTHPGFWLHQEEHLR